MTIMISMTHCFVGRWLVDKVRAQARTVGVQQAARNLRKQGAPIEVALAILSFRKV
jgi:uncharacterized protein YacL (UPF0231 family)